MVELEHDNSPFEESLWRELDTTIAVEELH
jgi:hypothetical protein